MRATLTRTCFITSLEAPTVWPGLQPWYASRQPFSFNTFHRMSNMYQGEDAEKDRRIKIPFSYVSGDMTSSFIIKLATCRYNEPPKNFRNASELIPKRRERIRHWISLETLKLPELSISIAGLPRSAFEARHFGGFLGIGGILLYQTTFTLEMVIESASLRFEIWKDSTILRTHQFGSDVLAPVWNSFIWMFAISRLRDDRFVVHDTGISTWRRVALGRRGTHVLSTW